MEQPPPRMKGKKLKTQIKADENASINNFPVLHSACLSSSLSSPCATSDTVTSSTAITATSTENIGLKEDEQKKEIPKLTLFNDLNSDLSPPISPAKITRSRIWLTKTGEEIDASLFYTNLGDNVYKINGNITCSKLSLNKESEMRIYFEPHLSKQIKEITGDNKVQFTVNTAFSNIGLLVGGIFFDTNYYFSPLKVGGGDGCFIRGMTLIEFEDFVSSVDKSIAPTSWSIRITGLVNMF